MGENEWYKNRILNDSSEAWKASLLRQTFQWTNIDFSCVTITSNDIHLKRGTWGSSVLASNYKNLPDPQTFSDWDKSVVKLTQHNFQRSVYHRQRNIFNIATWKKKKQQRNRRVKPIYSIDLNSRCSFVFIPHIYIFAQSVRCFSTFEKWNEEEESDGESGCGAGKVA